MEREDSVAVEGEDHAAVGREGVTEHQAGPFLLLGQRELKLESAAVRNGARGGGRRAHGGNEYE